MSCPNIVPEREACWPWPWPWPWTWTSFWGAAYFLRNQTQLAGKSKKEERKRKKIKKETSADCDSLIINQSLLWLLLLRFYLPPLSLQTRKILVGLLSLHHHHHYSFPNARNRFPRKLFQSWLPSSQSATTGSVKTSMTMTEKIMARASEKPRLNPGENVWVNVDVLMTHDVSGPGSIGIFKREFDKNAKIWDRKKIVIVPDHYIFTTDERANRNVGILRDFYREQNIKYFYDIKDLSNFRANPDYKGVCHIALAQEGHCRPGEVLLGTDSHTCTAGAFGQFATGIGNTDAGFVSGTGKSLLKIIGEISMAGATYKSMEFVGTTIESLSMEEQMTLCNMVVEAGGKNGVVPPDSTTFKYLEDKTSVPYEPVYSDENAGFLSEYRFDLSKLEPLVAKPHSPDKRALARECKDVKIDRVYIGSCTSGKTEDFMAAAQVFPASGQKVKVPTFLVPATQKVWMDLYSVPVPGSGGNTCSQIFEEAGCDTPASPSCGACLGGPKDTYARMNEPMECVSTTNRNFPGRMGHKEGQIYLASPYTAAASALTGCVTDPREFLQ